MSLRLWSTGETAPHQPLWFRDERDKIRAKLTDQHSVYPCHFASIGETQSTNYHSYILTDMEGAIADEEIGSLAVTLHKFLSLPRVRPRHRVSLICLVGPPVVRTFEEERYQYWDVLSRLAATDSTSRESNSHPDDPAWNFSFAGEELFCFAATPAYGSRQSRVLGEALALVFQPMSIFSDIRGDTPQGKATKARIRARLANYDGVAIFSDAGSGSESTLSKWKQYFPNVDGSPIEGVCPFHLIRDSGKS